MSPVRTRVTVRYPADPQMTSTLRVAKEISCTEAEGPGRRYALWVQGCTLRCPGCCNPEMFSTRGGTQTPVDELLTRIRAAAASEAIEGVSVLGGEPFQQPAPLAALCRQVRELGLSVMLYSGYRLDELHELAQTDPGTAALLAEADLLVDGRYDASLPEARRRWIGSSNQHLHFLTARYAPDDPRFFERNSIEIRVVNGEVLINGWPSAADRVRPS